MQVFIAECSGQIVPKLQALGWGRMWVLVKPNPAETEPWAFDNGAFRDYTAGRPFDDAAYRKRLDRAYSLQLHRPSVAVVPDIVAGGMRSLDFSLAWREKLPTDWPWFLAVQDGMEEAAVERALPAFAGLFLGGSSPFKYTAPRWARLAHRYKKRFHYGRAGTILKLEAAYRAGADSLDSAYPLWTKARWAAFAQRWQSIMGRESRPIYLTEYVQ